MRLITLKTKQMIQTMGELRLTVYKDLRGMLGERALFKILVGRDYIISITTTSLKEATQ